MIFKDKAVVITGASAGVGAETARRFARAGANLLLIARGKKGLETIAQELRELTRVEYLAMDVADAEACVNAFKKAKFEFGSVDILVNNAGFHARGPVSSVGIEDLGRMIDVNLKAPIVLTRIALPYFQEAGSGVVVNVGSLAGRLPVPGSATYSASKSGLRTFTYAIAEEMPGTSIKFAVVSPGPIDTGFIMDDIDRVSDLTFSQPISTADEVAQTILDLCGNRQREVALPSISGFLTSLSAGIPWLARQIRPFLERRGARVKEELKVAARRKTKAARNQGIP